VTGGDCPGKKNISKCFIEKAREWCPNRRRVQGGGGGVGKKNKKKKNKKKKKKKQHKKKKRNKKKKPSHHTNPQTKHTKKNPSDGALVGIHRGLEKPNK